MMDQHLSKLTEWLAEQSPEAANLIRQMRAGDIGEIDALVGLRKILSADNNRLLHAFEAEAMQEFAPLREGKPDSTPSYSLVESEADAPPAVYRPKPGMAALNPLIEAAIAERAQFDGDVPEFRKGPLIDGVLPAIPVETEAMSPIAVGEALDRAAHQVRDEYDIARRAHIEGVNHLIEAAVDETALVATMEQMPAIPTGIATYRAGEKPQPLAVAPTETSTLLALSDADAQRFAFKTISTTQGRRSAIQPIEKAVQNRLAEMGVEVIIDTSGRGYREDDRGLGEAVWTMPLTSEGSTQANFSYMAVAARALARQLAEAIKEFNMDDARVLQVSTVDAIADRVVGWRARLVKEAVG